MLYWGYYGYKYTIQKLTGKWESKDNEVSTTVQKEYKAERREESKESKKSSNNKRRKNCKMDSR